MTDQQAFVLPRPLMLEQERLRGVFYGDPGVGKTTLAASFPDPCVIDTDAGLIAVALYGRQLEHFDPTGYKSLEDLYLFIKSEERKYQSIVIDSFTELQRLLLDEIVDDGATRDAAKNNLNSITRFVPEQGEYLANQRQLRRILDSFRRLNKHVVLTAGVRQRGVQRTPDMAPGALSAVAYWSSFIGEIVTFADSPDAPLERYVVFEPTDMRMAKSRFAGFGRFMKLPHPSEAKSGFDVLMEGVKLSYETGTANQPPGENVIHVPPTNENKDVTPETVAEQTGLKVVTLPE